MPVVKPVEHIIMNDHDHIVIIDITTTNITIITIVIIKITTTIITIVTIITNIATCK